ncbi:MAG TPA: hypothetical protein VF753_16780 [Terriglobales bacterium]
MFMQENGVARKKRKNEKRSDSDLTSTEIRQHTQWGTQFLVAAELERLGYTVSFTMGHNTAVADLMVATRKGKQFAVDVKGLAEKNSWNLKEKGDWENLYYILVYFPRHKSNVTLGTGKPKTRDTDRFFILTQKEAKELVREYRRERPGDSGKAPGFNFNYPMAFESLWNKLPAPDS